MGVGFDVAPSASTSFAHEIYGRCNGAGGS
jgi:hypothetical protein